MAMKFTYRSGQRPLDGFTLKRGVGRGAFGEVYFAVSDGGKEVALKLLTRGQTDAELRGVAHCINLKHPNLVHLFDLRTDARGDSWVVMEYVFGESLAQVINKHPTGLPTPVIREWFAALCRGVGYLHNQGVVHRDLKPGNIFIEHGGLKIGDYGLSRRISGSDGDLSKGVGTPYYMAPEIKNGNYTASIDIYACGIILFEMITGLRPFDGETPYEVLIKHLTETPDLTKLPPAYRAVIGTALEKDPAKRYATAADLARAVEEMFAGGRPSAAETGTFPAVGLTMTTPPLPRARPVSVSVPSQTWPEPAGVVRPVALPTVRDAGAPPKPAAGPLTHTARDRLTELAGGFALTPAGGGRVYRAGGGAPAGGAVVADGPGVPARHRAGVGRHGDRPAAQAERAEPVGPPRRPTRRRAVRRRAGLLAGRLGAADRHGERHQPRHRPVHRPPGEPGHVRHRGALPVLLRHRGGRLPVVDGDRPQAPRAGPPDPASSAPPSGARCCCSCGRASPPRR